MSARFSNEIMIVSIFLKYSLPTPPTILYHRYPHPHRYLIEYPSHFERTTLSYYWTHLSGTARITQDNSGCVDSIFFLELFVLGLDFSVNHQTSNSYQIRMTMNNIWQRRTKKDLIKHFPTWFENWKTFSTTYKKRVEKHVSLFSFFYTKTSAITRKQTTL